MSKLDINQGKLLIGTEVYKLIKANIINNYSNPDKYLKDLDNKFQVI